MNLVTTMTVASLGLSMLGGAHAAHSQIADATATAKPETTTHVKTVASAVVPTPPAPVVVAVQPGEYLEKIATDNGSTALRVYYANTDITNPDLIYPDQQLRIPTADETLTARDVPVNQQIAAPTAVESTQAVAPQRAQPVASNYNAGDGSVWDQIAACESGNNWAINTGNGFYGGLQFTLSSWHGVGGDGYPNQASREEQIMRGQMLQARQGWGAWPACTAKLGIR